VIAGAYTLHLYCERCNKFGDFSGAFHDGLLQTVRAAKAAGWRIDETYERCLCASCKPKGWELTPPPGEA
jgi:hypothetical protein